jgi:hypothetical protein
LPDSKSRLDPSTVTAVYHGLFQFFQNIVYTIMVRRFPVRIAARSRLPRLRCRYYVRFSRKILENLFKICQDFSLISFPIYHSASSYCSSVHVIQFTDNIAPSNNRQVVTSASDRYAGITIQLYNSGNEFGPEFMHVSTVYLLNNFVMETNFGTN